MRGIKIYCEGKKLKMKSKLLLSEGGHFRKEGGYKGSNNFLKTNSHKENYETQCRVQLVWGGMK